MGNRLYSTKEYYKMANFNKASRFPRYSITKPIRLIELFAGIGSQHEALKRLGFAIDRVTICEWAEKSIQAYNDIHIGDYTDYSKDHSKNWLVQFLADRGISSDYQNPMTEKELSRKGEKWIRNAFNNVIATNNLVNIMKANGSDLEITDKDKYEYIMTYSFPCQDLSLAGKREGMSMESGTRSGMLWQVERLLNECKELPQVLLMENVPEVIGTGNIRDFQEWELFLSKKGYTNYCEILNAKDYGIPQNRRRCFMVSILGEYNYHFPMAKPLTLRLKDLLEPNVDEKYYLSNKMLNFFLKNTKDQENNGNGFRFEPTEGEGLAKVINTKAGGRMDDNYIIGSTQKNAYFGSLDGNCPTLNAAMGMGGGQTPMISTKLRIRKLTPHECWRLMGQTDEAFNKAEANQSQSSLYHLAGDSIVVQVLEAIFGKFR